MEEPQNFEQLKWFTSWHSWGSPIGMSMITLSLGVFIYLVAISVKLFIGG